MNSTLIVFNHNVVEELDVFRGEADFGCVVFEFFDEGAVGINGVEIIDERFFEHKEVDEVLVFHRRVNLLLQLAGYGIDTLDMLNEVGDTSVDKAKGHVLNGLEFDERPALEERDVFCDDNDEAVLENKGTGGCDLEEEIVGSEITLGSFENHSDVFGFKFEPAWLVGVEGRIEGMLVDFELFDEVPAFGFIRGDINRDCARAILAFHEPAVN